ncbi:MAG: class I adenylate-forming enzyme family protein [Pseudomonadales bacterium]|nr:class I adenylate-forming enzyme family protein [Pseudomonadales bacterium]
MSERTRASVLKELTAAEQPYELVPGSVFDRPCLRFKNAPPTLRDLFSQSRSEVEFIIYEDQRLTFDEAYIEASKIAMILVNDYGVKPGDRVAISMRNYPEWILAFMAATSIGGIAVAMNALWQPEEMAYGLTDSGAKVLFADEERLARFAQIATPPKVQLISVRTSAYPNAVDLANLVAKLENSGQTIAMPEQYAKPEDDATLLYTSGSTGHPKGVASCHVNIISALMSWELDQTTAIGLMEEPPEAPAHPPATLMAVPLFHATGSHAVYLASYRHQRKLVCMYKWDPAIAAQMIEEEKITTFIAPAAMTGDLVLEAQRSQRDLSSLASVGGGGAPRAPEQVRNIEKSFTKALPGTGWGMTETNAIGTSIGGIDYLERPDSSGRCSGVMELKVIDEAGNALDANNRGELLIRGTGVFRGYWNRPDANAETFLPGGWMRTGDVAYLDDEGYLFIVDRIKDLVIRGGENIGCGEVEAALLEHPLIHEASVYAVPDERLGEEVGTTIYTETRIDTDELNSFLLERLARFKVPAHTLQQHEPLPRTASGKILKRELREEACKRLNL